MSVQVVSNSGGASPVVAVPQNQEELSLLTRVSRFFLSWISLPSITDLLSGNWFSQERLYTMAYTGLVSASCVGGLSSLVLLIEGAPVVATLLGGLSLCSATGAYMADQAIKQRSHAQCLDDYKKTNEDLRKERIEFSKENVKLKKSNKTYSRENKKHIAENRKQSAQNKKYAAENKKQVTENKKLQANVQHLSGEVISLRQERVEMKQDHRKICRQLEKQIKQTQENLRLQSNQNGKYEAQNNRYRNLITECRECIQQLEDNQVVHDQTLLARLSQLDAHMGVSIGLWDTILKDRQIFCEGYEEQLAALQEEIKKLQDPRLIKAQWDQHERLQKQIHAMEQRDKDLTAEIAQREGMLKELKQSLLAVRNDLAEQLKTQRRNNRVQRGNNQNFQVTVEELKEQIAAIDRLSNQYYGTPLNLGTGQMITVC